jgi:hypothetical protein
LPSILLQAITINVAINSKSNQLLALLISNNFVEMKGSVFKKTDARRHLQMTCLDIYERYHMQICLLFVMIEMLNKSKGGEIDWMRTFIWQLMPLFLFEVQTPSEATMIIVHTIVNISRTNVCPLLRHCVRAAEFCS